MRRKPMVRLGRLNLDYDVTIADARDPGIDERFPRLDGRRQGRPDGSWRGIDRGQGLAGDRRQAVIGADRRDWQLSRLALAEPIVGIDWPSRPPRQLTRPSG